MWNIGSNKGAISQRASIIYFMSVEKAIKH